MKVKGHNELNLLRKTSAGFLESPEIACLYPTDDIHRFNGGIRLSDEIIRISGEADLFPLTSAGDAIARDSLWNLIHGCFANEQDHQLASEMLIRRYTETLDDDIRVFFPDIHTPSTGN